MDYPLRTNYNLRGHRSDVILVKWNEPYQKLASCDSSGIIFVWIKYEGRWSIELINDRNTPVTHFSWSHDGRMALICYQDGFVLVGSVAGQRYWSSMLNLESTITCGIWTPDDQQVYFGTTQGQVIVMDVHGAMVSQVQLYDVGITSMAWSCEKFKMEEGEEAEPGVTNASKRSFVLAVSFQNGFIYLLKSFDDVSPAHINTGLNGALGMVMEWSNSRELLAVAGTAQQPLQSHHTAATAANDGQTNGGAATSSSSASVYENMLKFYTESGVLLYQARIPYANAPVSALTWGHNDKRLFIATGTQVHIAWVSRRVASLQLLCRLQIQACIGSESILPLLPLPSRIKALIGNLFAQTIRCCVPDLKSLREFVSRPPMCSTRLHCTMIRHDDDSNLSSGTCYTLYLEYLGGLVPLLKGKRTSKIRPEFVIFDPQVNDASIFFQYSPDSKSTSGSSQSTTTGNSGRTDSSDSEYEDRCRGSPRTPRKRKVRQKKQTPQQHHQHHHQRGQSATAGGGGGGAGGAAAGERATVATGGGSGGGSNDPDSLDELAYVDTLPEEVKLVEVTSNIWGTKFKIHGLAKTVPANLGQVTYKTSLLHLQPRQMTLVITELRDDFPPGPDPNFNPNLFSEDEDDALAAMGANSVATALNATCHILQGGNTNGNGNGNYHATPAALSTTPLLAADAVSVSAAAAAAAAAAATAKPQTLAQRRLNESNALAVAPMSPRPNRMLARHMNGNGAGVGTATTTTTTTVAGVTISSSVGGVGIGGIGMSPLARAESYDDDSSNESQDGGAGTGIGSALAAASTSTAALLNAASSSGGGGGGGNCSAKTLRPKNIATSVAMPQRMNGGGGGGGGVVGGAYNTFKNSYSRSSSNSSCQSRHAISPLYCDGAVPTLQSPKNAVAPTDIIFERPAVSAGGQTTLMSYSSNADYASNVVQVKNALMAESVRCATHVNPVPLNLNLNLERMDAKFKATALPPATTAAAAATTYAPSAAAAAAPSTSQAACRRRDMLYIDEETQSPTLQANVTASGGGGGGGGGAAVVVPTPVGPPIGMKRTPTVVSIAPAMPDAMTRSCSVGYLDSVAITPSDEALSALRKDAPNKRLILVDSNRRNRKKRHNHEDTRKPKLQQIGKSKSLDSSELLSTQTKLSSGRPNEKAVHKLQEIAESSACSSAANTLCFKCSNNVNPNEPCRRCANNNNSNQTALQQQQPPPQQQPPLQSMESADEIVRVEVTSATTNGTPSKSGAEREKTANKSQQTLKASSTETPPPKRRLDVITSFTDSPLFTRKHRFGGRSKDGGDKQENGFSLVKQLSEVRWRRKEAQNNGQNGVKQTTTAAHVATAATTNGGNGSDAAAHGGCAVNGITVAAAAEANACNNGTIEATPLETKAAVSLHTQALTTLENIISRLRDLDEGRLTPPASPQRMPRSSPASPAASKKSKRHQSNSPIRHILNSPLLNRRQRKKQNSIIESSDEEGNLTNGSGEESGSMGAGSGSGSNGCSKQYRDLETFQKAQLRQKLKRGKIEPNGTSNGCATAAPVRREFVMHNKAPMWNEMSQVYQLDFGGRVTQESAKNFQIEFRGKQVMQFGRIDGNAYTLDFQYPFSALQAFAVALANVTQRLK